MEPASEEAGKGRMSVGPDISNGRAIVLQGAVTAERGLVPPRDGTARFLKPLLDVLNDAFKPDPWEETLLYRPLAVNDTDCSLKIITWQL